MEVLTNRIQEKNYGHIRYSFLDVVKGIGIIFVIFGHIIPENLWIRSIIYSFHMPMFFLISGFFPAKRDEKFFGGVPEKTIKKSLCAIFRDSDF